jgi:hypothetical protein
MILLIDMDTSFYLKNLWRWKCGLPEIDISKPQDKINIDELRKSEWSPRFEKLMRNRLIMGAIRYGKLHAAGKPDYNRIGSILKRIKQYETTKNKELLVDIANLCLLEFEEGIYPESNFTVIDDGEHVEII